MPVMKVWMPCGLVVNIALAFSGIPASAQSEEAERLEMVATVTGRDCGCLRRIDPPVTGQC